MNEKNELVAQLKDQRQEARVRTQMERSYVEHDSKMQLQMARKQRELDRAVRMARAGAGHLTFPLVLFFFYSLSLFSNTLFALALTHFL